MIAAVIALAGLARATGLDFPNGGAKLLPPEQAFRFSARALDANTLEGRFDVADGYYLYRDKLRFALQSAPPAVGSMELPAGKRKHDEFFGDVEIYRGAVIVKLPIAGGVPGQRLILVADSQGCADAGVCYPPTRQRVELAVPVAGAGPGPQIAATPPRKGLFD